MLTRGRGTGVGQLRCHHELGGAPKKDDFTETKATHTKSSYLFWNFRPFHTCVLTASAELYYITNPSLSGLLNKGLFLTRGSHILQVVCGSAPPGMGLRSAPIWGLQVFSKGKRRNPAVPHRWHPLSIGQSKSCGQAWLQQGGETSLLWEGSTRTGL